MPEIERQKIVKAHPKDSAKAFTRTAIRKAYSELDERMTLGYMVSWAKEILHRAALSHSAGLTPPALEEIKTARQFIRDLDAMKYGDLPPAPKAAEQTVSIVLNVVDARGNPISLDTKKNTIIVDEKAVIAKLDAEAINATFTETLSRTSSGSKPARVVGRFKIAPPKKYGKPAVPSTDQA